MVYARRSGRAEMAGDTLGTLLRLRRLEVRQQMSALAVAMRAEEQACRTRDGWAATIVQEATEARAMAERDATLEGYVPWRARAAQSLRDATAQATAAGEATRVAQVALGEARGATRAVELAVERRQVDIDLASQRSAQHALDDAARRPGGADR
jgi:hypothetical protein